VYRTKNVFEERLPEFLVPKFFNCLPDKLYYETNYNTYKKSVYRWLMHGEQEVGQ